PPAVPCHYPALVVAFLSLLRPRRRLRYFGLSPNQSRFRHAAGFPAFHAGSQTSKAPGDHRTRPQPYLGSTPLVRARTEKQTDLRCPQLVRLERLRPEICGDTHHLQRRREVELDLGPR